MGWLEAGDLQALIWGAHPKPTMQEKVRTLMIDRVWNRFQLDAFSMNEKAMTTFAEHLYHQKAVTLFGYVQSIYHFAQFIRTSPFQGITFKGIFTTAELLIPSVRHFIEETFQCKVFNRYSSLELGNVACECQAHNGMHTNIENNYVEILCDGSPAKTGVPGELIITNLNNLGMPFIRYRIGDIGTWHIDQDCVCGRASPKLVSIEGRIIDSFFTYDGKIIWSGFLAAIFNRFAHPAIKQFRIVQKSLKLTIVYLVSEGEVPRLVLDDIVNAIQSALGEEVNVNFEFLKQISPLPSGKHQYAISELNRR